ncbi:hypothetical protein INR49_013390 [Caranx melampygus]|nr:hypothetical protein INR49_013390 [Caranx melampygus]
MAAPSEVTTNVSHVGKKKKQPPARYWQEQKEKTEDENKVGEDGGVHQQGEKKTQKTKKRKKGNQTESQGNEKKFISGKSDPFPGPAPIPKDRMEKFKRKEKIKKDRRHQFKLRDVIARSEEASELAQRQAARFDLLLPEDAGFLEGDEDEDTCMISQEDIAEAVDVTAGAKAPFARWKERPCCLYRLVVQTANV